jgi:hypothetical protein
MKIIITIVMGILLSVSAPAQTWNEWFKQKETQKKYLVKQIALLRLYLGYVKEGYEIANKGLTTIQNIKNGDFNLHRDFFGSLNQVNPHIANSAKVADIIAFQVYVIRDLKAVKSFCKTNQNFTPEELRYVAAVYSNMLFLSDACISELLLIIRPDQTGSDGYRMKDDERLMRIDKLYDDMRDKHAFVQSFGDDVRLIAKEREREQKEVQLLQKQFDVI